MTWYWEHKEARSWSLNAMYRCVGVSKQSFHQYLNRRRSHQEEVLNLREIIRQIREDHPTMCCRDMYFKINPVYMGRDRFEALCREYGFVTERKKSSRRTTDSTGVVRFENLLLDKKLTDINQAWCSDITYYEVDNTYYYITFILDCYSRRILGHHVSSRLFTEQTSLPAMKKAILTRGKSLPTGIIFHSDGGGQYYDQGFLSLTKQHGFRNSMCEFAYENGKAERVNGVIKNNYLKHWHIQDLGQLIQAVDRAVHLYNTDKPHSSLQRQTPMSFETMISKLAFTEPAPEVLEVGF
jgi:transposase InsO family protein